MGLKVKDLRPGMNGVNLVVRVLDVEPPKTVRTRSGERTISEATVGDETGRVKLTLWGRAAGTVTQGDVIEISGAWTTSFRGYVQLNVGGSRSIRRVSEDSVPSEEEIPNDVPRAPQRRFTARGRRR